MRDWFRLGLSASAHISAGVGGRIGRITCGGTKGAPRTFPSVIFGQTDEYSVGCGLVRAQGAFSASRAQLI